MLSEERTGVELVGQILKFVRGDVTLEEASSKVGVSRSTLSKAERADKDVTSDSLIRIAKGYGLPPEDLISIREESKTPVQVFGTDIESKIVEIRQKFSKQIQLNLFGRGYDDIRQDARQKGLEIEETKYGMIISKDKIHNDVILKPLGFDTNVVLIHEEKVHGNQNFKFLGYSEPYQIDPDVQYQMLSDKHRLIFIPPSQQKAFEDNLDPLLRERYSQEDRNDKPAYGIPTFFVCYIEQETDYCPSFGKTVTYINKGDIIARDEFDNFSFSKKGTYIDVKRAEMPYPKHYQLKFDSYDMLEEFLQTVL